MSGRYDRRDDRDDGRGGWDRRDGRGDRGGGGAYGGGDRRRDGSGGGGDDRGGRDGDRDRGGGARGGDRGGNGGARFGDGRNDGRGGGVKLDPSGEWRCDGCNNSNFSWRKTCKRCNAPKSAALKEAERAAAAGWLLDGLEDTTNRIFIKGFDPEKTSEDDLRELFCGIGVIARVRQRTGFPDQWPYAVKIYRDERGEKKDEAVITYDDPHAAQSAPGFYDGYEFNGKKLTVEIAKSKPRAESGAPPPAQSSGGGGYGGGRDGGGGRYGGGGGRSDYRDRARPY